MARRAVNLHGCALPHFAPLLRRLRRPLLLRVGYGVMVTVTESEYAPTETFWPGGIRP